MEFLKPVFGENPGIALLVTTLILIALIIAAFWIVRSILYNPTIRPRRGRVPRLAVSDAAIVDSKRRIVLVRRDNVEHLVMIGGVTDVVIEQNITLAQSAVTRAPVPHAQVSHPSETLDSAPRSRTLDSTDAPSAKPPAAAGVTATPPVARHGEKAPAPVSQGRSEPPAVKPATATPNTGQQPNRTTRAAFTAITATAAGTAPPLAAEPASMEVRESVAPSLDDSIEADIENALEMELADFGESAAEPANEAPKPSGSEKLQPVKADANVEDEMERLLEQLTREDA